MRDVVDLQELSSVSKTTRYIVTCKSKYVKVGHHIFLIYYREHWYSFEPLKRYGSKGSRLSIFDSFSDLRASLVTSNEMVMSVIKIRHSRWSTRYEFDPTILIQSQDDRIVDIDDGTVVKVEQDEKTLDWVVSGIHDVLRFSVKPHFMCCSRITLNVGSIILLPNTTVYRYRPRTGHCYKVDEKHWIEQSPFINPYIRVLEGDMSIMIGNQGSSILPYIQKSRLPNCMLVIENESVYIRVVEKILAGNNLYLRDA